MKSVGGFWPDPRLSQQTHIFITSRGTYRVVNYASSARQTCGCEQYRRDVWKQQRQRRILMTKSILGWNKSHWMMLMMRPTRLMQKYLRVDAEGVLWWGFVKLRLGAHSHFRLAKHFSQMSDYWQMWLMHKMLLQCFAKPYPRSKRFLVNSCDILLGDKACC